jgi:hypothetical protein
MKINKEMKHSIQNTNVYLTNALCMLCALLLCAACTQDGGLNGTGEKVAVRFALVAGDYAEETVTRGATTKEKMLETVQSSWVNGWSIRASLMEESLPPARAAAELAFVSGARVRVIVKDHTAVGQPIISDEYTYENGILTGPEMVLTAGNKYTFVAYTYNTTTSPPYNDSGTYAAADIAATNDFFVGTTTLDALPASDDPIPLSVAHAFMRLKYDVWTNIAGLDVDNALTSVSLINNYKISIPTDNLGALAEGVSAGDLALSNSVFRLGYTGDDNPFYIKISGTVERPSAADISFTDRKVAFKHTLSPNRSYVLRINFVKSPIWAESNIYWVSTGGNTGYLTFVPAGSTTADPDARKYQGVFFLWGSLVGISPDAAGDNAAWNNGNTCYMPTYDPTYPTSGSSWTAEQGKTWWGTSFSYWGDDEGDAPAADTGKDTDFFSDPATANYAAQKGDICRYLGVTNTNLADYRLPTALELLDGLKGGLNTNDASDWTGGNSVPRAGYWTRIGDSWWGYDLAQCLPDGTTTNIPSGADFSNYAYFPASGAREQISGVLNVGGSGNYWSSSAAANLDAYYLNFYSNAIRIVRLHRGGASSVRCVKAD